MKKRVGTYKMMRREQLKIWKYLYNKSLHENIIIFKTHFCSSFSSSIPAKSREKAKKLVFFFLFLALLLLSNWRC
jgi:hypothetical protein